LNPIEDADSNGSIRCYTACMSSLVRTLVTICALLFTLAASSPAHAQDDCGQDVAQIPDFSLVDQNPNSPTYGQTYTRDALMGQVLVIYWALAT